ncbi:alpha/beta-Hydrolase [Glarea lozoyensis ATCC 20868]|uniref:1-alkyl-2-acetylglycerophosphocholine esterase n=1 Tax=Glarea lozoyensis (strain ATCC 20868 / MF5171) TaxID=1116229 RepID=S3CHT3_GLAL2|nr:alpha/beta-Hydrolase [Glarea lozoyensis ATCC 20868]EPE26037.1 alpha/beta-Hydrolase [Glarea lozoyensis ATCC 20868]
MLQTTLLACLAALCNGQFVIPLPALTGPSQVGTITLELVDNTRLDPLSPTPQARDLMISVFYPIQHTRRYTLSPAYDPLYAEFLTTSLGVPPGIFSSVISQSYAGAYLHPPDANPGQPNILLYSPGYGGSREEYTATLENLASYNYIVVGIDHPYDTGFIAYPNNRTVTPIGDPIGDSPDVPATSANLTQYRAADFISVINALGKNATFAKQIPGVHGKLDVSKVGVLGHSLGGASAATAMALDSRFACGSNLDGAFWGNLTQISKAVTKPFLLVEANGHNRTSDASFAAFLDANPKGKYVLDVKNAKHATFTDLAYLSDVAKAAGIPVPEQDFGTIGGERMLVLLAKYLDVYFRKCLGGGDIKKGLEGVTGFPEVTLS